MPYSQHITIYGALPSFCGGDDCGKILRLADHEGTVEPAWDFEVEGLPSEPGGCGQVLTLCDDGCGNPTPAWCDPPGGLPDYCGEDAGKVLTVWESEGACGAEWVCVCDLLVRGCGSCGQVFTLVDDGCGNPTPAWCDVQGGLPDPGGCGQVLMLADDGCGNPTPAWCDAPGGLPEPGGCGQVLMLVDDGCGNPVPAWADSPGGLPGIECGERYLKTIDDGCGNFSLEWSELPCGCFDPGCSYDWCSCQNFLATVTIAADLILADPCCGSDFVVFSWGGCSGDRLEVSGPIAFDDVREMNVTGCLFFSCDGVFIAPNSYCSSPSGECGQLIFYNGTLRYYNGSQWKTLQTTS